MILRLQRGDRVHLTPNLEDKIVSPLNRFRRVRQRKTVGSNPIDIGAHFANVRHNLACSLTREWLIFFNEDSSQIVFGPGLSLELAMRESGFAEGLDRNENEQDVLIRLLLEGIAAQQPESSACAAVVKSLSQATGVRAAWVTEYDRAKECLKPLSFWMSDGLVERCPYSLRDTACGAVIEQASLVHYSEGVDSQFPLDANLRTIGAVSYLGAPLLDVDGTVLGHIAIADSEPMPLYPKLESVFRIFAARAAVELQRRRAERQIEDLRAECRRMQQELEQAAKLRGTGEQASGGSAWLPDHVLTVRELRDLERENLRRAMEATGWRVAGPHGAAKLLGVPPSTLASRLEALGLKRPR